MAYDDAPEHVQLAVNMIQQMERLDFPDETILEACLLVIQDTLNNMNREERVTWRIRLSGILSAPADKKNQQATL